MPHSPQRESAPPLVATRQELRDRLAAVRRQQRSIGLVPTMGALHAGHLSLVEASQRETDFTVVSIFVNPLQFGPAEDFQRYPRTLEADLAALGGRQVGLVFAPAVEEVYRAGCATTVDVGPLAEIWEGKCRPGHFRGVATVVLKLFHLVQPDVAYFGRKDYQQSVVVRRMVDDLDLNLQVRVCPTVREPDGLALSSRNKYLSASARQEALVLSRSLRAAEELVSSGERRAAVVLDRMHQEFARQPAVRLEYAALVHAETLAAVEQVEGPTVALVAAVVQGTRLIDNQVLSP